MDRRNSKAGVSGRRRLNARLGGMRVSVIIREYTPADVDACRDLWRALTQRHRDIHGDPSIGGADPGILDSLVTNAPRSRN
jgi:hypothetical protein